MGRRTRGGDGVEKQALRCARLGVRFFAHIYSRTQKGGVRARLAPNAYSGQCDKCEVRYIKGPNFVWAGAMMGMCGSLDFGTELVYMRRYSRVGVSKALFRPYPLWGAEPK